MSTSQLLEIKMLTKLLKIVLTLFFTLFLFSCSNVKSAYDYDSSIDFSALKTYQWDTRPAAAFTNANPLIAKRVKKAIEDNLQRKGLAEAKTADIKISYQVSVEKKLSSSKISTGIGMSVGRYNRGNISISSGNSIRETTEGTLMIDMVDVGTNNLIWRSTTTKPVSGRDATPEESEKRIGQLIYGVFENFPPKKKL